MTSVCWPLLVAVEGELVPNPELAAHIRELLLENQHVGEVLQVRSVEVDDRVTLVGVRVSVLNLPRSSTFLPCSRSSALLYARPPRTPRRSSSSQM